ncbi:MAG: hypothetical protein FJ098_05095 [Deltaproteobacteria bacterium]|nr:hypothetical protein [Deltaproteobacteria bacterium]
MTECSGVVGLSGTDPGGPYPGDPRLLSGLDGSLMVYNMLKSNEIYLDDPVRHIRVEVFEPRAVEVVAGRSQDLARVVNLAVAAADRVPVYRRRGGGGAVVLAPGMLVIAVSAPNPGRFEVRTPFARVQEPVRRVLARWGADATSRGTSDLALGSQKILGSSLFQTRERWVYQGVLLVCPDRRLFDRYLAYPDREPAYRAGRSHLEFTTSLMEEGLPPRPGELARPLAEEIMRSLGDEARSDVAPAWGEHGQRRGLGVAQAAG